MRFLKTFNRAANGGSSDPAIGSDSVPTAAPSPSADNQVSFVLGDLAAWPTHRFAVVYHASTSAAAVCLPCDLYVWEENLQVWFKANVITKRLRPNTISYIDVPIPARQPGRAGMDTEGFYNPGSVEACLVIGNNAAGTGVISIAMGPDATTIGQDEPGDSVFTSLEAPAKSDTVDLVGGIAKGFVVANTGNVKFDTADGQTVTLFGLAANAVVNQSIKRIWTNGTTATIFVQY